MRISYWSSDVCSSDLAGEPFAPGPVLPQLGQREFVDRNVRIDPGTGITVPVPDPAWLRGGVDQLCAKPRLTQPMEQIDAAEARADYQRIAVRFRCAHSAIGRASCRERVCQYG